MFGTLLPGSIHPVGADKFPATERKQAGDVRGKEGGPSGSGSMLLSFLVAKRKQKQARLGKRKQFALVVIQEFNPPPASIRS